MTGGVQSAYFRLLGSLLYREPSSSVIDMLADEGLFSELPYAQEEDLVCKGQAQITGWLGSGGGEERAEEARSDYMRLLVGIDKVLAAPWGSVYTDEDRLLFNKDTLKVRRFYQRHGMMLKEKHREPDDHIGLELEFLAHLLEGGDLEAARDFAEKHMHPWIFRWNDDVQKHARSDYYRGLANMAIGGIQKLCRQ